MNHAFKELLKSSLTIFLKKLITSAYSMSSISLGLNPVLQKFYEMICQITVSKMVCGIFLVFVDPVSFIIYCEEQFLES